MIELKRGHTLKLDHADGATVHMLAGEAWLSICEPSARLRAGDSTIICNGDTVLIYAFNDATLGLEAAPRCRAELRRRVEVRASG